MAATKKTTTTKTTKPKATTTTTVTTVTKTTTTGGTKKKSNNDFSWSRLFGLTGLKQKISRKTGVPFSKAGRDRKIGAMITKGISSLFSKKDSGKKGCVVYFFIPVIIGLGIYCLL